MKKTLALALAVMMFCLCALTVSAAETTLPDLDCAGWWKAHSEGIAVTEEGFTVTFTATAYADASLNWHAPLFVLYGGDEAKVNGTGYNEYWVHRADNYGWAGAWGEWKNTADHMAELNALGVTVVGEYEDGCWDNWVADMIAGQECTITAKLDGSNAVVSIKCHGVTNTVTVPVDATKPVYVSLSGEMCTLTNIKLVTPDAEIVEPETTAPVAPETTAPVAPETTAPVAPETTAPVAPETTAPVAPETTAPVAPETTAATEPAETEPAAGEDNKPGDNGILVLAVCVMLASAAGVVALTTKKRAF